MNDTMFSPEEIGSIKSYFFQIFFYIVESMKTLIVELDDEVAEKLERVAPGRTRQRSEFIRNALRKALWEIEEQATAEAYRLQPDRVEEAYVNAAVWEPHAKPRRKRPRR